jgi:hypothetical protein
LALFVIVFSRVCACSRRRTDHGAVAVDIFAWGQAAQPRRDAVMMVLIVYTFSLRFYPVAPCTNRCATVQWRWSMPIARNSARIADA